MRACGSWVLDRTGAACGEGSKAKGEGLGSLKAPTIVLDVCARTACTCTACMFYSQTQTRAQSRTRSDRDNEMPEAPLAPWPRAGAVGVRHCVTAVYTVAFQPATLPFYSARSLSRSLALSLALSRYVFVPWTMPIRHAAAMMACFLAQRAAWLPQSCATEVQCKSIFQLVRISKSAATLTSSRVNFDGR